MIVSFSNAVVPTLKIPQLFMTIFLVLSVEKHLADSGIHFMSCGTNLIPLHLMNASTTLFMGLFAILSLTLILATSISITKSFFSLCIRRW